MHDADHSQVYEDVAATNGLDNDTLRIVIERHDLKQAALARLANISDGHLARVLNGQHPVTANLLRCAYSLTQDPDLLEYIAPDQNWVPVSILNKERDPMPAVMRFASSYHNTDPERQQLIADIDNAMQALAAFRVQLKGDDVSGHRLDATG